MKDFLDRKAIGLQWRLKNVLRDLREKEDGDTNFVSIIVIIVIVMAVAAIFKEQLAGAINLVFSKLTGFINNGGN